MAITHLNLIVRKNATGSVKIVLILILVTLVYNQNLHGSYSNFVFVLMELMMIISMLNVKIALYSFVQLVQIPPIVLYVLVLKG
jgi:hypothetical protein